MYTHNWGWGARDHDECLAFFTSLILGQEYSLSKPLRFFGLSG